MVSETSSETQEHHGYPLPPVGGADSGIAQAHGIPEDAAMTVKVVPAADEAGTDEEEPGPVFVATSTQVDLQEVPKVPEVYKEDPQKDDTEKKSHVWLQANSAAATQDTNQETKNRPIVYFIALVFIVIAALAIILPLVLTDDDDGEESSDDPDINVDFTTGISMVTKYAVNATINARLARSVVKVTLENAVECVAIHSFTMELPVGARVAKVDLMDDASGCSVEGETMELEEARDTFMEEAGKGLPGAYIEERDGFSYSVQVSMTPFGSTTMEFVVEQLLWEEVGEVKFQVPVVPYEKVDQVVFDLTISDASEDEAQDIVLDMPQIGRVPNTTSFHMEFTDARQQDLRRIVRGSYKPGRLPEAGVLYTDGKCFEHVFHPSSLEPMPKNVIILVDVSDSMAGPRLVAAKSALTALTDTLSSEDTLTIQTFAYHGTEDLWGMNVLTPEEKEEAKQFINTLTVRGGPDNLFAALGEGLIRAEIAKDKNPNAVTVLVLLSDGQPRVGERSTSRIAGVVWEKNQRVGAKIFSLAFSSADLDLLRAISIMNGGVTSTLRPGDDIEKQMRTFFESEFGTILLSDVSFALPSSTVNTENVFPVLANGTELVVRGLLPSTVPSVSSEQPWIAVKGTSRSGPRTWQPLATDDPFSTGMPLTNTRCFQSYAHAKINQLLELSHATKIVGDEVIKPLLTLSKPCPPDERLEKCIKADALALAMDANLVVSGLTAMATQDASDCFTIEEDAQICVDGTTTGTADDQYWDESAGSTQNAPPPTLPSSASPTTRGGTSCIQGQIATLLGAILVARLMWMM